MFGGRLRDSLPVLRILAIKTPDEMAAQAERLVAAGYRCLKVKAEGDVNRDVARVAAIRERVGDAIGLTVDANQSWSVKDAISALIRMAEYRIDLAEQPVAASDFSGLKLVTDCGVQSPSKPMKARTVLMPCFALSPTASSIRSA